MRKVIKKDEGSELERAYRANKKGLLTWATRATRSIADAEDLVQDAFTAALADTESLIDVDDLAAWLFAALRNKVRDLWRQRDLGSFTSEFKAAVPRHGVVLVRVTTH